MRNRAITHIRIIFLLTCHFVLLTSTLLSQEKAKFQLLVPAPDPIQAGETITFQVITQNSGSIPWDAGDCQIEVEIYNSEKKYIVKADRIRSEEEVPPGDTFLGLVFFNIPTSFRGGYYFRVGVIVKGQKIAYSDFQLFNVSPLEVVSRPPSKFKLNGNAIFSYKNDSKNAWGNHAGNISLNLLGTIYQNTLICNVYTNHTEDKPFDLYNFAMNYYGDKIDLNFGDIMPYFSDLSLANAGMRGMYPVLRTGRFTTSVVGAQAVSAVEGSADGLTPGTFARYLYGIEEKYELSDENYINLSFVQASDDSGSIGNYGQITPTKNQVMQVGANLKLHKYLTLVSDFAMSSHSTDTLKSMPEVSDSAYRLALETEAGLLSAKAGYKYVGTGFNSAGSPTIVKNQTAFDALVGMRLSKIGSMAVSYVGSTDNLKNDPKKTTADQKTLSVSSSLKVPLLQSFSLGYTSIEIKGNPINALNNYTNVMSMGMSYSKPWEKYSIIISLNGQKRDFRDEVNIQYNTDTVSVNFGTGFVRTEKLSVNLGVNNTQITDVNDSSLNVMDTYSMTGNFAVVKDKLILAFLGNSTQRKDNGTPPAKTVTQNYNMELTYYFNPRFAWTLGGGSNQTTDELTPAYSLEETRINTRLNIGL